MTEAESLVLEHLRHIRGAMDGLREDMREVKEQIGSLEKLHVRLLRGAHRIGATVGRIEQRLEPIEA
jgi:hypothetical protein